MANKSYNITSGKVLSGIPATVPNDVSAGVWTPTADAYGRILDASWANLPLNEFVAVAGSEPQALVDELVSVGLDPSRITWSVGNLTMTFNAWVGIAVDYSTGRVFCPRGGGHVDSSINGVWQYNLEFVGGWSVFNKPSDPDAVGFEWVDEYNNTISFTGYPFSGLNTWRQTTLPDGKPTSAHTYGGVFFNEATRKIETAINKRWSYSIDNHGKNPESGYWEFAGSETKLGINNYHYFDSVDNTIKGYMPKADIDVNFLGSYGASSNTITSIATGFQVRSADRYGRKMHCFGTNSAYRVLDFDSLQFDSAAQATTWQSTSQADQELVACVYIPQWNKIVRRFSSGGRWILFNPVTLVNEDWTPAGNTPPTTAAIGNKYLYYDRRKCLVCISANNFNTPSVFIMRIE